MENQDFIQLFILITGIAGQLFVANRNYKGFFWWILCNIAAVYASVLNGLYGMALLYVFYSAMCFYSIWKWKKLDTPKSLQP